ncbi:hypothetical protein DESC_730104 [Desulfosarcina cetonica]|nr:hypothetical protein DESC_730104 [Desulfosarcina cetonica]
MKLRYGRTIMTLDNTEFDLLFLRLSEERVFF